MKAFAARRESSWQPWSQAPMSNFVKGVAAPVGSKPKVETLNQQLTSQSCTGQERTRGAGHPRRACADFRGRATAITFVVEPKLLKILRDQSRLVSASKSTRAFTLTAI